MQKAAIKLGQKVIIIDDLISTGGTLRAAINLVGQAGGIVEAAIVLVEKSFKKGYS
jgi:adenine/guanine phosphoribosyltransferase-like PRPP-binding protein